MSDITDFLLARIAEDEEAANAALADSRSPWGAAELLDPSRAFEEDVAHIDTWNPNRVLVECEAKRSWVEYVLTVSALELKDAHRISLRFMASPYANHRDYDQAWRA